jgi:hypothetical protein
MSDKTTTALPAYRFYHTNKGCEQHADPECLCDVIVTNPAPISKNRLVFGDMALESVGGKLTAANFDRFARTLLGCADAYHELEAADVREEELRQVRPAVTDIGRDYVTRSYGSKKTPWAKLTNPVRESMLQAMKDDVPWAEARWLLGPTYHETNRSDWLYVRKYYNIGLSRYRKQYRHHEN